MGTNQMCDVARRPLFIYHVYLDHSTDSLVLFYSIHPESGYRCYLFTQDSPTLAGIGLFKMSFIVIWNDSVFNFVYCQLIQI